MCIVILFYLRRIFFEFGDDAMASNFLPSCHQSKRSWAIKFLVKKRVKLKRNKQFAGLQRKRDKMRHFWKSRRHENPHVYFAILFLIFTRKMTLSLLSISVLTGPSNLIHIRNLIHVWICHICLLR